MIETADSPRAGRVANVQVGAATERLDSLIEKLFSLRRALFGHQELIVLRSRARHRGGAHHGQDNSSEHSASTYPHRTEPPFTLITSPVTKVARSDTANRIGPAISSGVATRWSGIVAKTAFRPDFVSSAGLAMSVSTHPGATQFTRMLCRASSA